MIEREEMAFGFDPRHLEYLGDLDPETLRLERRAPCAEGCGVMADDRIIESIEMEDMECQY